MDDISLNFDNPVGFEYNTTNGGTPQPDFSSPKKTPAKAPNGSFATGLNLLFINPSAFVDTLISGNADNVPIAEVNKAATTPVKDNAPNPLNIPGWLEVVLIGGLIVAGLFAFGLAAHEVRR